MCPAAADGVTIAGNVVRIGLFHSSDIQVRMEGNLATAREQLQRCVDGLSFSRAQIEQENGNEPRFEVAMPILGRRSPFQWKFFGEIRSSNDSVTLAGRFGLPRFVETYFFLWLLGAAMLALAGVVVAVLDEDPLMWLLPAVGIIVLGGGFAVLSIGRSMTIASIQKVAAQFDRIASSSFGRIEYHSAGGSMRGRR